MSKIVELEYHELEEVNGGFICGGLCILGGIVAGAGLFAGGVSVGRAIFQASY